MGQRLLSAQVAQAARLLSTFQTAAQAAFFGSLRTGIFPGFLFLSPLGAFQL